MIQFKFHMYLSIFSRTRSLPGLWSLRGLVVSMLACGSRDPGSNPVKGANFVISKLAASELTQLIKMSTLDIYRVDW